MGYTIADKLDETVWREFVQLHPQGNIFQTPEMFQVFSRAKGYRPEIRAAVCGNGQVLAMFQPVQVSLQNGLMRRLTTRSIAYGGALCTPDAGGKEALAALLCEYRQKSGRDGLYTELRHHSDRSEYQSVYAQAGFRYQDHLNYLIDLDCTAEDLFNRIGSRTRKHIRREIKRNKIVVEEVQHASQIYSFYELVKKSYQEAHIPIADISLFEAAFEILYPLNMVKFWLARIGGTVIASSAELIYKNEIYGWYGGVNRAFSNCTPSELLTWHILKWGVEQGYGIYDFGGAGTPDEKYGVRDFKAKFGGRLVSYGRNTCIHAPLLLRLSTIGYNILRRFIAR